MARTIWVEPSLYDLERIADYVALENSQAARELVRRVFEHVEKLGRLPDLGPHLPELPRSRYRQIIEPPSRVIYRSDGKRVYVLHVFRGERLPRPEMLSAHTGPDRDS